MLSRITFRQFKLEPSNSSHTRRTRTTYTFLYPCLRQIQVFPFPIHLRQIQLSELRAIQYPTSRQTITLLSPSYPLHLHIPTSRCQLTLQQYSTLLESTDDREGEPTKTTAAGTAIGRLGRIGDGGGEELGAGTRGEEALEAIGEGEEGDEMM